MSKYLSEGMVGLSYLNLKESFFENHKKGYLKACKFSICNREYFIENKEAVGFVEEFSLC